MTISNEQIQALKALYANVEKQAHALRGNPREYSVITGLCPVNVIEMHAQKIQALLTEKGTDKALIAEQAKRIDFLKEQLSQLANFNPDWDKLESATDSLREHMAELTAANKRITELEARTLTVKLPEDEDGQPFGFGKWANSKLPATTGTMTISQCEDSWREAFKVLADAAGITLTVGGE